MKTFKKIRNLAILGAASLASVGAMAEGTVTVEKVQGSKAIVKFEGMKPKAGESYDLGGGGGGDGGGGGNRHMYLDISSSLLTKAFAEGAVASTAIAGTIGWNFGGQFELGIPLSLTYAGSAVEGGSATIGFGVGIDFDFNFVKNNPGEDLIPYIHVMGASSITKQTDAVKGITSAIGVGIKFFLNDQVSIIAGLDFSMSKALVEGATLSKGISVPIGIRAYF